MKKDLRKSTSSKEEENVFGKSNGFVQTPKKYWRNKGR